MQAQESALQEFLPLTLFTQGHLYSVIVVVVESSDRVPKRGVGGKAESLLPSPSPQIFLHWIKARFLKSTS